MARVGRPTEFKDEFIDKALDYIEHPSEYQDVVPTVAGLSLILGVTRTTIYEWAKVHPEFANTLEDLKAKQESELVTNGLTSIFNPAITKMMLMANHDYREKTDTDVTSKGDRVTIAPILYAQENSDTAPVQPEAVSTQPTESTG